MYYYNSYFFYYCQKIQGFFRASGNIYPKEVWVRTNDLGPLRIGGVMGTSHGHILKVLREMFADRTKEAS